MEMLLVQGSEPARLTPGQKPVKRVKSRRHGLLLWDFVIVRRWHRVQWPQGLHRILTFFVRAGDGWVWALVALALYFALPWLRFKTIAGQALLAVAISLPVYWAMKLGLRRTRPYHSVKWIAPRVPPLDKYSFPSGHTMNNLAVAMTLAMYLHFLWPLAVAIPVALGILRVFYGVHFLTDIAGGALLGAASALSASWLFPHLFHG